MSSTKKLDIGEFLSELVEKKCSFSGCIIIVDSLECEGENETPEEAARETEEDTSHVYDMFRDASCVQPPQGGTVQDAILMDNPGQS